MLTHQLGEILNSSVSFVRGQDTVSLYCTLQENAMLSQENVTMAIQSLAQFVNDSVNSPVDHTRENLNTIAIILTTIAYYVQNQTIVDSVVN